MLLFRKVLKHSAAKKSPLMIPSSSGDDCDPFAGDEVEAVDIFRSFSVWRYDHIRLLQCKSQTMMTEMALEPAIAVSMVCKETQFLGFHNSSALIINIFLHSPCV